MKTEGVRMLLQTGQSEWLAENMTCEKRAEDRHQKAGDESFSYSKS